MISNSARWLVTALIIMCGSIPTAQAALKSPWDIEYSHNASKYKQKQSTPTDNFHCPTPIHANANLSASGIYRTQDDPHHDQRDPSKVRQYHQDVRPYSLSAKKIVQLADWYYSYHDPRYAQCATYWLASLARDNALGGRMKTSQAHYQQSWSLAAYAIAWLKVRTDSSIDKHDAKHINAWLVRLADADAYYFNTLYKRGHPQAQNLSYWAGVAVMSAGIAANRQNLFKWGIARYKAGASSITNEGFLPAELKRGQNATGYHIFAAEPLTTMAQFAYANHVDLYAYKQHALKRLVAQILITLNDNHRIAQLAGEKQASTGKGLYLGWLHYFLKREPDKMLIAESRPLLKRYPGHGFTTLGGVPSLYP